MDHPLEKVIDRREALRRAALMLGGTLSAPAIMGVLAGCDASTPAVGGWTPRALTASQADLVAVIAERIIPETDTPGARGAEVHRFIDTMLAEYYTKSERAHFVDGLEDVDARARRACGNSFVRCSPADQHALLEQIDRETFASAAPAASPTPATEASKQTERGGGGLTGAVNAVTTFLGGTRRQQAPATPFFRTMKELTILGYYTSRIGATTELRHIQVPGRFQGCVPLTNTDRAFDA
jgi:hypothetical protein